MRRLGLTLMAAMAAAPPASAQDGGQEGFKSIYRELVETNTVGGTGSCTRAAARVAKRLRDGGYGDADLFAFAPEGAPEDGGIVATLPGRDPRALLLLGHLDTVPAAQEDWGRDPFVLTEDGGYYVARGAMDMKGLIAVWVDAMIRLRSGPRPQRTVRMALTCGEEGVGVNGLRWLVAHRPDLLKADFALNEGGGGRLTPDGRPAALAFQVLEKTYADFQLEAVNPGGHSSVPRPDNAIVALAGAIGRIAAQQFPIALSDTTRAYFRQSATPAAPAYRDAMRRIADAPDDPDARATLVRDPQYNATLRTTCVATRIAGGHANNALPQRATAIVNCRILPGETAVGTLAALQRAAGKGVTVTPVEGGTQQAIAQALPTPLVAIAEQVAAEMFPGVPVIPTMAVAASDAPVLIAAGVPTFGVPGIMTDADGGNMHGRNERVRLRALLDGRRYINRLVDRYLARR